MNATAIFAEQLVNPQPTHSDEELVASAVRGEQGAFVELVQRHHDRVVGLTRRLLGRADVDDAVQEIYITLLSKLQTFKHQSTFQTWLTTVVLNRCRTEQRWATRWWKWLRNSYAQRHEQLANERANIDHSVFSESNLECDEQRRALHDALRKLEHKDREVLTLRYFDEMEISQIAKLLQCKPNTIEVRLTRARAKLRAVLEMENDSIAEIATKQS